MRWLLVLLAIPVIHCGGCANENKRKHWQDCANITHEVCHKADDFRACEYEFYKECINGS